MASAYNLLGNSLANRRDMRPFLGGAYHGEGGTGAALTFTATTPGRHPANAVASISTATPWLSAGTGTTARAGFASPAQAA